MIGNLVRVASGQVDPKEEQAKSLLVVGPENLHAGGGLDKDSLQTAEKLGMISGKYAFDSDAILYSKIRPNLNKVCLPDFTGLCSADMYPLWVRDKKSADRIYVYYLLTSERFLYEATSRSFRTGIPKINRDDLESITVTIPPLPEQRHIAKILRTWDEAIEKATKIQGVKKRVHSWLTEKLLIAPTITNASEYAKAARPLSEFTKELTERNSRNALGRELVMGVSNTKGIVPMREQTIAGDISRYKILPPRAFSYNPMRINVGSIAMSRLDSEVLISPDYVLFACTDGSLDPDYFDHLCNTHWWSHHITESGTGSVRQRIYYDDLAALRIVIPPFQKQKKIANCLNQAQREIELIEAQIAALEKQKRGLMQKLLTGEWRVN
jgi:type I restriction enzyme S subunit